MFVCIIIQLKYSLSPFITDCMNTSSFLTNVKHPDSDWLAGKTSRALPCAIPCRKYCTYNRQYYYITFSLLHLRALYSVSIYILRIQGPVLIMQVQRQMHSDGLWTVLGAQLQVNVPFCSFWCNSLNCWVKRNINLRV